MGTDSQQLGHHCEFSDCNAQLQREGPQAQTARRTMLQLHWSNAHWDRAIELLTQIFK